MITQKTTQGLLISTVKNANGELVSQVSGDEMINGAVTVKGASSSDLIDKIKPHVQHQPDYVWDGIKSAIDDLL